MESKHESTSFIFSNKINMKIAEQKLNLNGARLKATQQVWILRESSVQGLLTVTHFNKETNKYEHRRLGFVDNEWQFGPADREKATLFSGKAKLAFKDNLPESSVEKLVNVLDANGFKSANQVLPDSVEATKANRYSIYKMEPNELSNRYTKF